MNILSVTSELQHQLGSFPKEQIALVPTMGCLHEGHISLIRKAKRLADIVVVSIYVNPLQFSADEDLDNYPKPFEQDVKICKQEGVDFLFHPQNLYPEHGIKVGLHVSELSDKLCGQSRQGHFDGVATVVNILFNIVQPNIAIFGEKDFQQLTIIQRMVSDLYLPIEVIGSETIREKNGLAKSSRNRYLSKAELKQASEISVTLKLMQGWAKSNKTIPDILHLAHQHLEQYGITPDYLDIRDEHALQSLHTLETTEPSRIFIAAKVGKARLIDNMPLFPSSQDKNITENPDKDT